MWLKQFCVGLCDVFLDQFLRFLNFIKLNYNLLVFELVVYVKGFELLVLIDWCILSWI